MLPSGVSVDIHEICFPNFSEEMCFCEEKMANRGCVNADYFSRPAMEQMHSFIHNTSQRADLASSEFELLQVNCLSRNGSWCMCGFQ